MSCFECIYRIHTLSCLKLVWNLQLRIPGCWHLLQLCFSHGASYYDLQLGGIHVGSESEESRVKNVRGYWDCWNIYLSQYVQGNKQIIHNENHLNEMFMRPKPNVGSCKPVESEPILLKTISFLRFALKKSLITLSCISVTLIENWRRKFCK